MRGATVRGSFPVVLKYSNGRRDRPVQLLTQCVCQLSVMTIVQQRRVLRCNYERQLLVTGVLQREVQGNVMQNTSKREALELLWPIILRQRVSKQRLCCLLYTSPSPRDRG